MICCDDVPANAAAVMIMGAETAAASLEMSPLVALYARTVVLDVHVVVTKCAVYSIVVHVELSVPNERPLTAIYLPADCCILVVSLLETGASKLNAV